MGAALPLNPTGDKRTTPDASDVGEVHEDLTGNLSPSNALGTTLLRQGDQG